MCDQSSCNIQSVIFITSNLTTFSCDSNPLVLLYLAYVHDTCMCWEAVHVCGVCCGDVWVSDLKVFTVTGV